MTNEKLISLILSGADQEKNMQMLCKQNRDFIFRLAVPFLNGDVLADDLINAGMDGIRIAVGKYDPSAGVPFQAFSAYWVRDAMKQFLQGQTSPKKTKPVKASDPEEAQADQTGAQQKNLEVLRLLNQFREAGQRLDKLKQRLEDLSDIRLSPANFDGGGSGSALSDFTGNRAVKIKNMEDKVALATGTWLDLYWKIYNLIEALPERTYRIVMTSRYLIGYTWPKVAEISEYTEHYCFDISKKALKLMNDMLTSEKPAQTSQNGPGQP